MIEELNLGILWVIDSEIYVGDCLEKKGRETQPCHIAPAIEFDLGSAVFAEFCTSRGGEGDRLRGRSVANDRDLTIASL